MSVDDMKRLVDRFNNPPAPQFHDAANAIAGIVDPQDAWRRAAEMGVVPDVLVNDRRRRFAQWPDLKMIRPADRPTECDAPPSLEFVYALASNPSGIMKAEEHARELARRLAPWGAVSNDEVVWNLSDNPYKTHPFEVVDFGVSLNSAYDTVFWTFDSLKIPTSDIEGGVEGALPWIVQRTISAYKGWEQATARHYEIREPRWPLDLSRWRYFADLANPFEPLLGLWLTGYRFVSKFQPDDPVIRLYMRPAVARQSESAR